MSKKQTDHNKNYHKYKVSEREEEDKVSERKEEDEVSEREEEEDEGEEDEGEEDEDKTPDIWKELNNLRNILREYDISIVKKYIHDELKEEVEIIKKSFHLEFDNVKNDDPFKIESLILLGELGITIYKKK